MADINTIFSIEARTVNMEATTKQVLALQKAINTLPKGGKVTVDVRGTTAGTMDKKALAAKKLGTEMQKLKAMGPVNLQVTGKSAQNLARATAQTRALKAEMTGLERAAGRVASRIGFLASAVIAGLLVDSLGQAVQRAAGLEGRMRALDVGFTKTGQSGRRFYETLRTTSDETRRLTNDVDRLRFTAESASDALAKIMVGGLEVDQQRLEKMKLMSIGAGALFGRPPAEMMTDLTTAWLRQSYKLADNLGLVVRRMDAYKKMADQLGVKPTDLTATQKAEAFGREMLESTGADLLVVASQIETPLIKLENAKERVDTLKLAFGDLVLEGIMPTVDALGSLSDEQLESGARITMLIAKTGLWLIGLQQIHALLIKIGASSAFATMAAGARAGAALRGLEAIPMGLRTGGHDELAKSLALQRQQGAVAARNIGVFAGLAAAVGLYVAVQDNLNRRMAESNELMADMAAQGLKYVQFLSSIGLQADKAGPALDQMRERLAGTGVSGDVRGRLEEIVGSMQTYSEELAINARELAATEEQGEALEAQITTMTDEAITNYIEAVREAAIADGEYGVSMEDASLIARDTFIPALIDSQRQVEDLGIAQLKMLAVGETGWDKFATNVTGIWFAAIDTIVDGLVRFGNAIGAIMGASMAVAVEAILFPINAFVSEMNALVTFSNATFGTNFGKIPGLKVGGITLGGGIGTTLGSVLLSDTMGALLGGAAGTDGEFGFGLYEKFQMRKAAPATAAYQQLIDQLRTGGPLGYLPPGVDPDDGDGGAGKAKVDDYTKAIERLKQAVDEADLRIALSKDPEAVEKLLGGRDKTLADFMVDAMTGGFMGRFVAEEPELARMTKESAQRYFAGIDELAKKAQEALDSANENHQLAQEELRLRESLGLEVDRTKVAQSALKDYIDLAANFGEDIANQYEGVGVATEGWRDAIDEQAAAVRNLRLGFDLSQIGYRGALAAAAEPDPNRRMGVEANTLLNQFDRQMREAIGLTPGSQEAFDMAQTLQDLHVEIATLVRGLGHEGLLTGAGAATQQAILADVQGRMDTMLDRLDAGAFVSELEANTAAINANTLALGGTPPAGGKTQAQVNRAKLQVLGPGGYAATSGAGSTGSFAGTAFEFVPDDCGPGG
jgi:hypothetical protein